MLSPLAIATLGIGFGPASVARIGLWPDSSQEKPKENGWLGGGGDYRFLDQQQSADAKRQDRERLGIIPAEVKRLAEVVARIEARDVSEPDQAERRAVEALARELEQENIAWREAYAEAMRDVLHQIIDAELRDRLRRWNEEQDEEAAMLMRWFLDM